MKNQVGNIQQLTTDGKELFDDAAKPFYSRTGEMIAAMYRDLMLGRESKLRQALIDEGWTPPPDKVVMTNNSKRGE